jgi:hypothetical protein
VVSRLSISVILWGGGKTGVAIANALNPGDSLGEDLFLDVNDRLIARREDSSFPDNALEARSDMVCGAEEDDSLRGKMEDMRLFAMEAELPVHSAGT